MEILTIVYFYLMNRLLYILLTCFIVLSGCKKGIIDENIEFSETIFEYTDQVEMVYEVPLNIGIDIPWFPITVGSNSSNEVDDPLISAVKDINLKNMNISIVDPAGESFYFLKDLVIYISKDSLPELELAHHYNVSDNVGNILYMQPSNAGALDEYVKSGDYNLRLKITTGSILPTSFSTLTFVASMNFNVTLINER